MRALALVLLLAPLSGCFGGPYAADLAQGPAQTPRLVHGVWEYSADGEARVLDPNATYPVPRWSATGFDGAEPNIGATVSGALFMTSADLTLRSRDGGLTWQPVYEFDPVVGENSGWDTGDPMLWVDPVTDRVYSNHMYPALVCFATAWSEDEGDSWTQNDATCTLPGVDHQKFFTALPGPLAPAVAGLDHPTVLFQCSQKIVIVDQAHDLTEETVGVGGYTTHCNMSYDGGDSWPAETVAAADVPVVSCGGLNGHPAAAPDGTVVVPITHGCDGLYLSVSQDSGLSWTVAAGPKTVGAESIDPEVSFAPDGTLYAMWRGSDHLAYLARTPDLGKTWDGPWKVSPPHVRSTVFQALSAGADGRVAMAFLGTDDTDAYPSDAPEDTQWHLYIVTSEDADAATPALRAYQVTRNGDPVQVGCVWLEGGGNPCRNLLDFIDSTITPDGTFHVAFTKGCWRGCRDEDDRVMRTAEARLAGWSLWGADQGADRGPDPNGFQSPEEVMP